MCNQIGCPESWNCFSSCGRVPGAEVPVRADIVAVRLIAKGTKRNRHTVLFFFGTVYPHGVWVMYTHTVYRTEYLTQKETMFSNHELHKSFEKPPYKL